MVSFAYFKVLNVSFQFYWLNASARIHFYKMGGWCGSVCRLQSPAAWTWVRGPPFLALEQWRNCQQTAQGSDPACCLFLYRPCTQNGFYNFKWLGEKIKRRLFPDTWKLQNSKFDEKFYLNMTMLACVHIVCCCFHTTAWSSCDGDHMACWA